MARRLMARDDGTVSGSAIDGPSLGSSFNGGFQGAQLSYQISAQGYGVVASGRGEFDGGCHVSFQSFDNAGNPTLAGTLHVNHSPGAPCP